MSRLKNLWPIAAIMAIMAVAGGVAITQQTGLEPRGLLAAGSPDLALTKATPGEVLHGEDAPVTLTVENPAGSAYGYNLSFRDVLPAGVSYIAGSASVEPTIIANAPGAGQTTLIWENVSDIAPGATINFGYSVTHDTSVVQVGDTYTNSAGAYVNSDPRFVPDFNGQGQPAGDSTGSDTATADTSIAPFEITKVDPEEESELLRGVHRHQTVYTLEIQNNYASPTSNFEIVDFLPAGLEFLGCGAVAGDDNTTDAPTNPGSPLEYPGANPIFPGNDPAAPDCVVPDRVRTVNVDPDGPGPMPAGVYTKVVWTGLGNLAPGAKLTIQYKAAIPIRENTMTWSGPGGTPGITGDATTGGPQGANLDNNSGPETSDEQVLPNFAAGTGTNNGTSYTDDVIHEITAEDFSIHKRTDPATIIPGQSTTWTLVYEVGEYREVRNIKVEDLLPDGSCPRVDPGAVIEPDGNFDDENLAECASTAADAPLLLVEDLGPAGNPPVTVPAPFTSVTENADGSWDIIWDDSTVPQLDRIAPSSRLTMFFNTTTRENYQELQGGVISNVAAEPVLANDRWTNEVVTMGVDYVREVNGTEIDADEEDPGSLSDPAPEYDDPAWEQYKDNDESSASQAADGPVIDKQVAQAPVGSNPPNCLTETYIQGPAEGYAPGDHVCYRLEIDYPDTLDTGSATVQDFTPPGTLYVPGSMVLDATSVPIISFDDTTAADGLLTWQLDVQQEATKFIAYIKVEVTQPSEGAPFDVTGNLMKMSYTNSFGEAFNLRDATDHIWEEPRVSLLKGVASVNGQPAPPNNPNVDDVDVQGGDTVTFRIDLFNDGNRPANDIELLDKLPASIDCSMISNISNGGVCLPDPFGDGSDYLQWDAADNIDLPAIAAQGDPATTTTLTYDFTVPPNAAPGTEWINVAAVSHFTSPVNTGPDAPVFDYYPSGDLDPNNPEPNTAPATDPSDVQTPGVVLDKTRTTEIADPPGNSGSWQATIGEEIYYTVELVIPQGSTLFAPITLSDTLGTRVDYLPGTATVSFDADNDPNTPDTLPPNVALQADATMDTSNVIELLFTGDYVNPPNSGDDIFTITYAVQLLDDPQNIRGNGGNGYQNDVDLSYLDNNGNTVTATDNVWTGIVEPNLMLAKAHNQTPPVIAPFQTVRYTLTLTNPRDADGNGDLNNDYVSTAYNVEVVDTLPAGMFPVDASGAVLAIGDCTNPPGGTSPCPIGSGEYLGTTGPNGEAQIKFIAGDVAPDATVNLPYDVQLVEAIAGTQIVNSAVATGTSLPDPNDDEGERTSTSTDGGGDPYPGYEDEASTVLELDDPTIAKSVDPADGTIGEDVQYTIAITIPPGLYVPDATVLDTLPDGLDFVSFDSVTCASGCTTSTPAGAGTDLSGGVIPLPATPVENADGTTNIGWWFGDIVGGAAESDPRVFEIKYTARFDDAYADGTPVLDADPNLVNNAALYWTEGAGPEGSIDDSNPPTEPPSPDDFNGGTPPVTAEVDPKEPKIALDKSETTTPANNGTTPADEGDIALGTTGLTYTLKISNTGNWPAYNIAVEDTPGSELENIVLDPDSAPNLSTTWNTAGWTTQGDTMTWTIPGPLAPGDSVTISYTADLRASTDLDPTLPEPTTTPNADVINTAEVPSYLGVPVEDYDADPDRYREYGDESGINPVTPDTVTLHVLFPELKIEKTTAEQASYPDVDDADLFTPFTWRVVIENSAGAGEATNIDLVDVLPPNWEYIASSAQFTHSVNGAVGQIEPTSITPAATGDTLTWTDIDSPATTLKAGEKLTVLFDAKPLFDASTNPGPDVNHVNTANTTGDDVTGSPEHGGGPYEGIGPDGEPGDTAEAHLRLPKLTIDKTPDGDPIVPGADGAWTITIKNVGDGAATNVVVNDTMPGDNPATPIYVEGVTYTPGTATVAPAIGAPNTFVEDASGYDATQATSPLIWTIGTFAAGGTYVITVPITANIPQLDESRIDNLASVKSDELPDPVEDPGHLVIDGTPNLIAAKTSTPADSGDDANHTIVEPTDPIDYEISYKNTGTETATGVVITDAIPTNTTYVPGSATSTPTVPVEFLVGGSWVTAEPTDPVDVTSVRWLIGNLVSAPLTPDNGTVGFGVTVNTPLDNGTVIENIAELDSDQTEPEPVGPVQHEVESAPILELTKSVSDEELDINTEGNEITYGLELVNTGDMIATNVVIGDAPPAGTTVVSVDAGTATAECTTDAGPPLTWAPCTGDLSGTTLVRWTLPSLDINDPVNVGFTVAVELPVENGTIIPNTATVESDQTPEEPSNEVETIIKSAPELTLEKSVNPAGTVSPGQVLTYTLVYKNIGSDTAFNTVLSDPIPQYTSYVNGSASNGGSLVGGSVVWNLGDLSTNQGGTVTFKVKVKNPIPIGRQIDNIATIKADNHPPVTDDVTNPIDSAPILEITKTSAKNVVKKGQNNTFFINVKVKGNAPAAPLTVADTLPSSLRFVSASDGGVHSNGVITWNLGNQNPGYSKDLTVVVKALRASSGQGHLNTVQATTPGAPPVDAEAPVKVNDPNPKLTIRKKGTKKVTAGKTAKWVIRVKNKGPGTAQKTQIQDIIPNGFSVVKSERRVGKKWRKIKFRISNGRVVWNVGNLKRGKTVLVRVTMRANKSTKGKRTNRAITKAKNVKQTKAAARITVRVAPLIRVAPAVTG